MPHALLRQLTGKAGDAEPAGERRRNVRHATVFQVARITAGDRQELCILRNVSPGGLKAEVYMAVASATRVSVELKTGHCLVGTVVWTRDQFIGVQFDAPVPMMQMLAHCSMDDRIGRIRPPRLDVDLAATLRIDHEDVPIRISNVSQAGMKFAVDRRLRADLRCELRLDELGWKRASIRWYHDGEAGVMFVQPMLYPEFAAWRRALWDQQHAG